MEGRLGRVSTSSLLAPNPLSCGLRAPTLIVFAPQATLLQKQTTQTISFIGDRCVYASIGAFNMISEY